MCKDGDTFILLIIWFLVLLIFYSSIIPWQLRDTFSCLCLFCDNFGTPLPLCVTTWGHLYPKTWQFRDTSPPFRVKSGIARPSFVTTWGHLFPRFCSFCDNFGTPFTHQKNHFPAQIHPDDSSFYKKSPIFATQSKPTHHKWFSLLARLTQREKYKFLPFFYSLAHFLFVTL